MGVTINIPEQWIFLEYINLSFVKSTHKFLILPKISTSVVLTEHDYTCVWWRLLVLLVE